MSCFKQWKVFWRDTCIQIRDIDFKYLLKLYIMYFDTWKLYGYGVCMLSMKKPEKHIDLP